MENDTAGGAAAFEIGVRLGSAAEFILRADRIAQAGADRGKEISSGGAVEIGIVGLFLMDSRSTP